MTDTTLRTAALRDHSERLAGPLAVVERPAAIRRAGIEHVLD